MATEEPSSEKGKSNTSSENAGSKVSRWFLATLDPILFMVHVTVIYLVFLVGDTLILAVIGWSFGTGISQNIFIEKLFEGIKIFSAIGTALAYVLHIFYSLFQEGRHVARIIRVASETKEEIS